MPVVHSDCAGSKKEPNKWDWERKLGLCDVCLKMTRIFKDREGGIVMWPHEGADIDD